MRWQATGAVAAAVANQLLVASGLDATGEPLLGIALGHSTRVSWMSALLSLGLVLQMTPITVIAMSWWMKRVEKSPALEASHYILLVGLTVFAVLLAVPVTLIFGLWLSVSLHWWLQFFVTVAVLLWTMLLAPRLLLPSLRPGSIPARDAVA